MAEALDILVVDKDITSSESYHRLLAKGRFDKARVSFQSNVLEALAFCQRMTVDIVLLGDELDGECGIDGLRELLSHLDGVPVVFCLSSPAEELAKLALQLGAAEVFVKDEVCETLLSKTIEFTLTKAALVKRISTLHHRLEASVSSDALTQLLNRHAFEENGRVKLTVATNNQTLSAVLFIDLDNFKTVNERAGYAAGDAILRHVAERIVCSLDNQCLVSRFGGDEFVILLSNLNSPIDAMRKAKSLIQTLSQPFQYKEQDFAVGASIGIACHLNASDEIHDLIRKADVALCRIKRQAKGQASFFSEALNQQDMQRMSIENEINKAIENDEFFLMYHPKYNVDDGAIVGVESLIRWQHPRQGVILPKEFIPIAEESGQVIDIGNWVLDTALKQFFSWHEQRLVQTNFTLSLNLSSVQLNDERFIHSIEHHFNDKKHQELLRLVEFEITEEIFAAQHAALKNLQDISLQLVIDNFGSGASSLKDLNQQRIKCLKIDRRYIQKIGLDEGAESIVRSIIAIGYELGIDVIAEGCESQEQFEFLQAFRCPYVQGFYLSRPFMAPQLVKLLKQ